MEQQIIKNPLVKEWLSLKRTHTTRLAYEFRITVFLEYFKMTPEDLLELSPREARNLCLQYQNENTNLANNTLLGRLTAVASFLDHYDKPIKWKRNTKVRPRPDVNSHVFSNGDLTKMFQVANTRDKCLLTLAASLGWEIGAFIDFRRETLRRLLARQEETGEEFIYFRQIREKTGQPRLAVLNPLAIEWARKWLKKSENITTRTRNPNRPQNLTSKQRVSDIFDLTGRGILNRIQVLARRADLKTVGNVKFHAIRKWVASGLSRSGFNEWQAKYVLGKSVPLADSTYLQTLEIEVKERYPSAYENYLNLETSVPRKAVDAVTKDLEEKSSEIEDLKKQVQELKRLFEAAIETHTGQPTRQQADMVDDEVEKMMKRRKQRA